MLKKVIDTPPQPRNQPVQLFTRSDKGKVIAKKLHPKSLFGNSRSIVPSAKSRRAILRVFSEKVVTLPILEL